MTKPTKWGAPSEDSDKPGYPLSLIRVFAVRMKKAWVLSYPLSAQRRLIRLGGCPGWSESLLGTHLFCWFCHVAAHLIVGLPQSHFNLEILKTNRTSSQFYSWLRDDVKTTKNLLIWNKLFVWENVCLWLSKLTMVCISYRCRAWYAFHTIAEMQWVHSLVTTATKTLKFIT